MCIAYTQPQSVANLTKGGLVVESRAAVTVSTRPNLEVERTVDPRCFGRASESLKEMRTNWSKRRETHLSFSVPKIEARYSAIVSQAS